jgi:hypothetical protein
MSEKGQKPLSTLRRLWSGSPLRADPNAALPVLALEHVFGVFGKFGQILRCMASGIMGRAGAVLEQFIQFRIGTLARAHEPSARIDRERPQDAALLDAHGFSEFDFVFRWSSHC